MITDSSPGTAGRPVRVAVVGAGPAGFFTAEALLESASPLFAVDLIERLPTPFGLVRAGVAPDHQKIKGVTRVFEKTAKHQRFRFLGNVEVGRDLSADELAANYDMVVYAIGSSGDRRLGIPGEELTGCHAGTAFVGWYNSHPDFREFPFDLTTSRAVVVGVGNVALDIARVLLRSPDELAETDIAGQALEALRQSQVREVVLLARRGPGQAAFTLGELRDVAKLANVRIVIDPAQLEAERATDLDASAQKSLEFMRALVGQEPSPAERTLRLLFCASPVEVLGGDGQKMRGVRVEENALIRDQGGVKAKGTGRFTELEAGLLFRSIGYFGASVPGVPFDPKAGVIPNVDGRVTRGPGGEIVPALYAVGWIRRGPLGVIGTNKADGVAVAEAMIRDAPALATSPGPGAGQAAIDALLARRKVRVATHDDWIHLDSLEVAAGQARGKVREKFSSIESMMNELLRRGPATPED